jgi:hypothetical protein
MTCRRWQKWEAILSTMVSAAECTDAQRSDTPAALATEVTLRGARALEQRAPGGVPGEKK